MVKKPSLQARKPVTSEQAEALANRLADKPYGTEKPPADLPETQSRTTISLPASLLREVEDLALSNKREGKDLKNVSAIVREALRAYLA